MNWLPTAPLTERSDDGRYELRGRYADGHFAWRARVIATDELVQSSADKEFVRLCCESHAEAVELEAV